MKNPFAPLLILPILALLAGCIPKGGVHRSGVAEMSPDKLALIKPGTTTRTDMIQWFGEPSSVGMDFAGKASAMWFHFRFNNAPFSPSMQQQMLMGVFETNNVLLNFTVTDQIKGTNAPGFTNAPATPAKSPKAQR